MNRPKPPSKRKVLHPDYGGCMAGKYPYVFCFERSQWKGPTVTQREDYRRRRVIVEANGGYMRQEEWKAGGARQPFSSSDIVIMRRAVTKSNPDLHIVEVWNGRGCYSFSVGARFRLGTGR